MAPVEVKTITIVDSYVIIQVTVQLRLMEIVPIVIETMNNTTEIKIVVTEATIEAMVEIAKTIAIKAHPTYPL